jgi:hypothetical protein
MLENGWTDFGVFPVAMHSFAMCAAPPRPGTRIRVQGEVTIGAFGITSASFVFALPNAEPLWRVTNFKQKIVAFPTGIRRWLFGKESSPFSFETDTEAGPSDAKWREFLESGQGIWSRVLAHGLLQPAELAALYAEPPTPRLQQMMEKFLEAGPGARRR